MQLTRDLFAIAKFLLHLSLSRLVFSEQLQVGVGYSFLNDLKVNNNNNKNDNMQFYTAIGRNFRCGGR